MAVVVEVRLTGLAGVLDTLQSLPAEIVSKRGGPAKTALRKGALVILAQEKLNLQAVTSNATSSGKRESTGFLLQQLIVTRGKPPSGANGERYLVRTRRRYYQRAGRRISAAETGGWLEYGTEKQPAEPWARPAVSAKGEQAIRTVERELLAGIERTVAKLERQNRSKK